MATKASEAEILRHQRKRGRDDCGIVGAVIMVASAFIFAAALTLEGEITEGAIPDNINMSIYGGCDD